MHAESLIRRLKDAHTVLAFTGAGISTGSGIPDFRGPQGIWKRWRPVYYQEFMTSHEARVRHWEFKLRSWRSSRKARPNAAHLSLVELDQWDRLQALVTQNIDGLHGLAGHAPDKIIELHGSDRAVECQSCQKRQDPEPVFQQFEHTRLPPLCECGGFLKPATISFGQQMPADRLRRAFEAAGRSDFVLTIGSTLEVEPAASVPRFAKQHGAYYVILNQGPTAQDHLCDLRLEGDATTLLPQIVNEFRATLPSPDYA